MQKGWVFVACLLSASPVAAQDQVFLTEQGALDLVFGEGVKVGRGRVALTQAQLKEVQKACGALVGASHEVFVGEKNDQVIGFAVVWEEIGKYKPITFMVAVDPAGKIVDIHIMIYREPIGSDVSKPWWRKMFKGKSSKDPIKVGKDILKINGATMSCESVCLGARKVVAILGATLVGSKAAALRIVKEDKTASAVRRTAVVMGSTCTIVAYGPEGAVDKALEEIKRVGGMLSLQEGEAGALAKFNEAAGQGPQGVPDDLATFLELALSYAGKTGGAYDPTVGPALKLWGFYDHRYNVPGKADISKAMAQVGYAKLSCDPAKKVASLKDRGMRIDPGGLGRGFALDRAIQILKKEGIGAALIDFGGRRYALGAPPGESAWTIDVRNPFDPSGTAMTLSIKDGAVCTLDRYEQFFEEEDKAYIGIIDSGSGRPIEGMASVTVWGKTCAEADALSMALFVRGIEKGMELAKSFGVEAAWIPVDEKLRLERTPGFGALQAKEK